MVLPFFTLIVCVCYSCIGEDLWAFRSFIFGGVLNAGTFVHISRSASSFPSSAFLVRLNFKHSGNRIILQSVIATDSREFKAIRGEVFRAEIDESTLGVPLSFSLRPFATRVDNPGGAARVSLFWQPVKCDSGFSNVFCVP